MQLMGVHPDYPVTVTRAVSPWQAALVGQPMFRKGGNLYGGVLFRVVADGGDPAESNAQADMLAACHNASTRFVFPPSLKTVDRVE